MNAHEGSLEVHGPVVLELYFNNADATREAFTKDGWFRTGDTATIGARGTLRLAGRSKDISNINGVKYLPHELGSVIEQAQIARVARSYITCFAYRSKGDNGEQVYVVYQFEYDAYRVEARANVLQGVIRTVVLFSGARPLVLPLKLGRLERSTLGKLSRAKVKASLLQGDYQDQVDLDS